MTEVREKITLNNNKEEIKQLGLYATKSYQKGEIILNEKSIFSFSCNKHSPDDKKILKKNHPKDEKDGLFLKQYKLMEVVEEYINYIMLDDDDNKDVKSSNNDNSYTMKDVLKLYHPNLNGTNNNKYEIEAISYVKETYDYYKKHKSMESNLYKYYQISKQKQPEDDDEDDDELFLKIMLIYYCNAFDENNGYLYYPNISRANHSCNPNCLYFISSNSADAIDANDDTSSTITIRACAPISKNDEITISYLGLFLYSDKETRRSILQTQKLFTCSCPRCIGIGDNDKTEDIASRIPCFKCHKRIKNVLDEDVSWGDGDIHYIAQTTIQNNKDETTNNIIKSYKPCSHCNSTIDIKQHDTVFQLMKQICTKVTQRMQTDISNNTEIDDNHDRMIQYTTEEEYDEQLYQTSSSILGIKHWCTNFMLSALVTRSLTTLHSNMILQSNNYDDEDEASSQSPDLELIAECIDSYQTYKTFLVDMDLHVPVHVITMNFLIGIMRCLISLGDEKSLNYALELLSEGSNNTSSNTADQGSLEEYITLFGYDDTNNGGSSSTMVNVIQTLKNRCLSLLEEHGAKEKQGNKKNDEVYDDSDSNKRLKT